MLLTRPPGRRVAIGDVFVLAAGARVRTWRVPGGHYFVVGDNAGESTDSRAWPQPFVPAARISGVAIRRWPWHRLAPALRGVT